MASVPDALCFGAASLAQHVVEKMIFHAPESEVAPYSDQRENHELGLAGGWMLSIIPVGAPEQRITARSRQLLLLKVRTRRA